MRSIRVLIVDDSLVFREMLTRELVKEPGIDVVGMASDPFEARDRIIQLNPDVMILDVEMPKMNGIEFLRRLLPQHPIPVVVSSSIVGTVFDALDAGAVDFVAKPDSVGIREDYVKELIEKIVGAAEAQVKLRNSFRARTLNTKTAPGKSPGIQAGANPLPGSPLFKYKEKIIAIGASTGGTEAILNLLIKLPEKVPGIAIVQHMPAGFTAFYAERLNKLCAFKVREAKDNDRLEPGMALVAPGGDRQMKLVKDLKGYFVRLVEMDKVSGHRPSVDYLFDSVADAAGKNAIGVILTGMGADGAKGLLKMRGKGAYTIGQDSDSCVVYGMPMAAYNIGAVMRQLPLDKISGEIIEWMKRET